MTPNRLGPLFVVLVLCICPSAVGQSDLAGMTGSWPAPLADPVTRWQAELGSRLERTRLVRPEARPQLAGLRPKSVELLEDSLLRKHPKLLKDSPVKARELLLRRVQRGRVPQLRGYMAEAIFLDRNPQWGYVGKANATQHDVYRLVFRNGRLVPENGQVKYHVSGRPALYARDMLRDNRAPKFLIPDDHVEAAKAHLRAEAIRLEAAGDKLAAKSRWRDYGRVSPIGATSAEIRSATTEAARSLARERYATYTSLGASLALTLGPALYDWARGELPANIAYRAARSLGVGAVGIGTDQALRWLGKGALRGTVRGNLIVGTALAFTEATWLLHEYGWRRAFDQPDFYEQAVGGVSALGLGLSVGSYATFLAAETGPIAAPLIGLGTGVLAGTVGYFGGSSAARAVMEIVSPEMLRREERQRLEQIKSSLDRRVVELQKATAQ